MYRKQKPIALVMKIANNHQTGASTDESAVQKQPTQGKCTQLVKQGLVQAE